jgi:hypothetical protein
MVLQRDTAATDDGDAEWLMNHENERRREPSHLSAKGAVVDAEDWGTSPERGERCSAIEIVLKPPYERVPPRSSRFAGHDNVRSRGAD